MEKIACGPREAAVMIGVSHNTIREALRKGLIPYRRLNRRILIPLDALRSWVNETSVEGEAVASR